MIIFFLATGIILALMVVRTARLGAEALKPLLLRYQDEISKDIAHFFLTGGEKS